MARRKVGGSGKVVRSQQVGLHQPLEADEVGVTREGAEALVGTVPIAGGAERHQLPQLLTGGLKEVDPAPRVWTQLPDAVRSWQGGGMEEDPGAAVEGHGYTPYFSNGFPIALGGIARPTNPASTSMVRTNGIACTTVGGSS